MNDPVSLELFVASPGDVRRERQQIKSVVAELLGTIGPVLRLGLQTFHWEHDLGPGVHSAGPQGLVDAHSNLATCDILVGVFWNRLGTPTATGETGTEHEFWRAFERWKATGRPHIMLYFSKKAIPQSPESLAQGQMLLEFKERLPKEVFSWTYKASQEFEKLFREHLTRHVLRVWHEAGRPVDAVRLNPARGLGLITSTQDLIQTNIDIVEEAEEVLFCTGSRSRDATYLRAIERKLEKSPGLIHYRILMGPPFRTMLKEHLARLLDIRSPEDRAFGYKSINLGVFEQPLRQAEVFMAGNEKRVLIVLPSRKGVGEYNTALVIDDAAYVNDTCHFVKQLYGLSRETETKESVAALPTLIDKA